MITRYLTKCRDRFVAPQRRENEPIVQNGLAITPTDMYELQQKGIPISVPSLGELYDEGYSNLDFTPPLEYTRGVDLNDLYEAGQKGRERLVQRGVTIQRTSTD